MPFPIYLPFFPGHQPNLIFSREAAIEDYPAYVALGDIMTSAKVFDTELPREGPILDAGCGGGRWLLRLQRDGRNAIGVDLHLPVLRGIKAYDRIVPLVAASVTALPVQSGSIAGLVSLGVVEHDEAGPGAALREFARVLRPGGRLLVSVPFNNVVRRLVINQWYRWYNTRWVGRGYYFVEFRFSRREIVAALQQAGFRIRACFPHDFVPPRNMGLVADRNMLNIRLAPRDGELRLHLPPDQGWRLEGWRGVIGRILMRVSPWLAAAEILVSAEKSGDT